MQLGVLIAVWATPRMSWGHVLFATALTGYILVGLAFEERDLLQRFGDQYARYRAAGPSIVALAASKARAAGASRMSRTPAPQSPEWALAPGRSD